MITKEEVKSGIAGIIGTVSDTVGNKPLTALGGAALGGAIVGATVTGIVAAKKKSSRSIKKTGKKIKHTKRGWKQDRKRFNKRQKWEVAYRRKKLKKSKSKSRKGIHYTKNGQPYKILANGRARFIKKR